MREVFICDAARTAIGRYAGALAKVRTDDLAAAPIRALVARNAQAAFHISPAFSLAAESKGLKPDQRQNAEPIVQIGDLHVRWFEGGTCP